MWILVQLQPTNDVTFFLSKTQAYSVGRKDCDLLFPHDKSISRRQATIIVTPVNDAKATTERQKLVIVDSSKFGTFVNKERMVKGVEKELKEGDVIEFGVNGTQVKIQFLPTVFCFSNMKYEEKKSLEVSIRNIGGHITSNIVPEVTTHLVVPSPLEVTAKGLLALIYGIPIVSPLWITEVEKRKEFAEPLPSVTRFLPPISDSDFSPDDFATNHNRRNLLRDKTFVFFVESQFKRIQPVIEAAGGTLVTLYHTPSNMKSDSEQHLNHENEISLQFLLKHQRSCFLDPTDYYDSLTKEEIDVISRRVSVIKNAKFSLINETEIGMAIVKSDLEHYCNPKPPTIQQITDAFQQSKVTSLVQQNMFNVADKICCTVPQKTKQPKKTNKKNEVTDISLSSSVEVSYTPIIQRQRKQKYLTEVRCPRSIFHISEFSVAFNFDFVYFSDMLHSQ
jgi:pSer/pThr/pTyr-binding forkhead associated (FHA) protein